MSTSPVNTLGSLGQSIWLDYIDRSMLNDGTLLQLIEEDGLAGLTSNPSIFEKAITGDAAYADDIATLGHAGATRESLYESLVLADIGHAADSFLPVYQRSAGRDGYVSIEVSPLLARDSAASVREARDLWAHLQRPNIMIKIPGTREGLVAVRTLLADGINVNVTLLFSAERYASVLEVYLTALEERLARGLAIDRVASVASFFLSRIDVKVDALLDAMQSDAARAKLAGELRGSAAIASAALAYRHYLSVTQDQRWQALASAGASTQRLLWASTGTKDPAYPDIKYVDSLVARDTVNTVPPETLNAYRDHGRPALRIDQAMAGAEDVMRQLAGLGVDMAAVAQALEEEGIRKFVEPYQSLLASLERLRQAG
jgi:transaldolase